MTDEKTELLCFDLTKEEYREYDFGTGQCHRTYRIHDPKQLFIGPGGTTHRIVGQDGTVHCVPAPGFHGCVLRWENLDSSTPVNF